MEIHYPYMGVTNTNTKVLFLCITCHLLLLKTHSNSNSNSNSNSKCQPPYSFPCRNFTLQFPFTHTNDRECGLFPVDGCDSEVGYPTVRIGAAQSPRSTLYILGRQSENRILVHDFILQTLLDNNMCLAFTDMSLINTPSVSLTFSPNITVFGCLDETDSALTTEYFKGYDVKECNPVTVYYTTRGPAAIRETRSTPYGCAMVQLPKSRNESGDLISLMSATFVVEWTVSEACSKCHSGGGKCLADYQNQFYCKLQGEGSPTTSFRKYFLIGCATTAAFASISIVLSLFIIKLYTKPTLFGFEKAKSMNEKEIEVFLKNNGNLAPQRYKYSDIEKMTNSFTQNLGKGGYGSVYKGKLRDGHPVAVKILDESKANGEDFMNEVGSISRTSHVNIVSLLGYCFEGCKRALVYEFMPNGSLEKFLFNTTTQGADKLGWQKLLEIALGIARGLEYLHQGCKTRILHLDIKPHNILLDKDFNPRISDFGLARLCPNRSSIISMMDARGTVGYIAPEVFYRNFGEVSHKSDVFSYGMMVLEITGGKKDIDRGDVDRTSEVYFPDFIYKQLEMDAGDDPLLEITNEDESRFAKRKLNIVGLWCIQTDPKDRPSMSKVVEMLEGKLESLHVPPKPYMPSPPRSEIFFSIPKSI